MTQERRARVKELFASALERPATERRAWLQQASGGDEDVLAEVSRLVAAHLEAGDFIEQPIADLHPAPPLERHGNLAGRTLQQYRLESLLGVGGMGEVYKAVDLELGRAVAIKLVEHDDPRARDRLRREARHASRINHPHICTIHHVGQDGDRPYIVMEFVEGQPLAELVPRGGLPTATAVRYAIQITDALAHAHGHGLVHRDLKSANVMITPAGDVKLLDFGLSRRVGAAGDDDAAASASRDTGGAIAGTLGFRAPEVLCGLPADARSDLWAVGVLLYEMLEGELPFAGRTPFELSSAILHDPPAPTPPSVPYGLVAIIERCLRKRPEDRFRDAAELRSALERLRLGPDAEPGAVRRLARMAFDTLAAFPQRVRAAGTWRVAAVFAAAVVILTIAAAWQWDRPAGPSAAPPVRALAVLPFRNLSGDASQDYFADGITEALIVELGRTGGLRVISRTTAMRYRATTKSLPEIARELRVDALVEGSVIRDGSRVRVTAELFQAGDRQVWAEVYERTMREILVLQRDIVRAITTHVRSALTLPDDMRLSVVRTVDPEVYEAYLKGRYHWNKRTRESLAVAVEQYERATRLDPTYAPAYVGLADCYNQLGTVLVGSASPAEMRPRARAAAVAALQIDDTLGEAHAALAYVHHYEWEWAEAEREFSRAVALSPNYALAHVWRANYLTSLNRLDEALASVSKALDLDPMSMVVNTNVGWTLQFAGRAREAMEAYRAALALDHGYVQAHQRLADALVQLGRMEEALEEAQAVSRLTGGSPPSLAAVAGIHAMAGRRREAEEVLRKLVAMRTHQYVSPWAIAMLYMKLGDHDAAFAWLERAREERSNGLAYLLRWWELDPLRGDPRYRALLSRVGLDKVPPGAPPAAASR